MGAACCVAARDRTIPDRSSAVVLHRNVRNSPSWNFRWDNRGRVAGEVENPPNRYSHGNSVDGLEIKGRFDVGREDASDLGSPLDNFRTPSWQKFPIQEGAAGTFTTPVSDLSIGSSFSTEAKDLIEPSTVADLSASKPSISGPSTPSLSISKEADSVFSPGYPITEDSTPSRWARQSPGNQLVGGVSDSRIVGMKSPNNSVSEGRQSFVLSTCSNDLTLGSHGGSSDGWSMRTFSELVASSQRERWSFDSEALDSNRGKITRSNSHLSASPSKDLQTCSMCGKLLAEKSSWSRQKVLTNNELSVVSVLACGHVYHAECLENLTPETEMYDPTCPACSVGEKQILKMCRKALKAEADLKVRNNWMSRNRVVDSDFDDSSSVSEHRNSAAEGKGPKMGTSSSLKSTFAKPFLRRHFSLGSKSTKTLSVNELSTKKKGFWARYR